MGFHRLDPLFQPGRLLVSPGVLDSTIEYQRYLRRHLSGDWGDICDYDKQENRHALEIGDAVLSQYSITLSGGDTMNLCIMTEAGSIHTVVFFLNEDNFHHEFP